MPYTPEQVLEQTHEIAERLREMIRDADALPVLKLRYIPLYGGSFVEVWCFDPERTDHMLTRVDLPPSESDAEHERPEGRLISACLDAGVKGVMFDLSNLKWINSTGLGILVSLYTLTVREGGRMAVVLSSPRILNVLKMTRLDLIFEPSSSEEQALDRLLAESPAE
jgi:anti-anti-sigma factor